MRKTSQGLTSTETGCASAPTTDHADQLRVLSTSELDQVAAAGAKRGIASGTNSVGTDTNGA